MDRHDVETGRDVAAARAAFDDHAGALLDYVARRLGPDDAHDVVAEAFRIVIERADEFDPERGSPRAWLFGIATNLMRRHWRTERRRLLAMARVRDGGVGDESGAVLDRLAASERVRRVLARAAELSPEDRDLLVLVAWEGMAHRDVADALGIPVGTVGSRLHRIRGFLREGDIDG